MIGDASFSRCVRPNINSVCIAIPYQLHSSEWVIPTEIHAADTGPVRWEVSVFDCNAFFRDGKYSTRAQYRDALNPSLSLERALWLLRVCPLAIDLQHLIIE